MLSLSLSPTGIHTAHKAQVFLILLDQPREKIHQQKYTRAAKVKGLTD